VKVFNFRQSALGLNFQSGVLVGNHLVDFLGRLFNSGQVEFYGIFR